MTGIAVGASAMFGVTRQTLDAIEQEEHSPTLGLWFRLAREFGAGFEEVFQFSAC